MSMMQAVRSVFGHYATFRGRARRSEYWKFVLFNILVIFVLTLGNNLLTGDSELSSVSPLAALNGLYTLVALIPGLAVAVRRLHDTGHPGWHLLIALIPFVGVILLLVWMCRDGDPGVNDFGPNPKGESAASYDAGVVEPTYVRPTEPEPVYTRPAEPEALPARDRVCPSCGAPVSAEAAFCTFCGSSLNAAAPARPAVSMSHGTLRPAPEKKPEEKDPVADLWQTPTDF